MGRSRYTEQQRQAAVERAARDGVSTASAQLDIPKQNISRWAKRRGVATVPSQKQQAALLSQEIDWEIRRIALARTMGRLAELAVEHLEAVLHEASPAQAATIAGILTDKAQLLTGAVTQRAELQVSNVDSQIEDLARQLADNDPVEAVVE